MKRASNNMPAPGAPSQRQLRVGELIRHKLARKIDLTTRNGLHSLLRADIERSSIRVF